MRSYTNATYVLGASEQKSSILADVNGREIHVPNGHAFFIEMEVLQAKGDLKIASGVDRQEAATRRVGSRDEVRKLLTLIEFQWFYETAETNPVVKAWLREVDWVVDFDLDHPTFSPMLDLAVAGGGMTVERKAEILATDFNAQA